MLATKSYRATKPHAPLWHAIRTSAARKSHGATSSKRLYGQAVLEDDQRRGLFIGTLSPGDVAEMSFRIFYAEHTAVALHTVPTICYCARTSTVIQEFFKRVIHGIVTYQCHQLKCASVQRETAS